MRKAATFQYYLFMFVTFMFVFQFALTGVIDFFKYWDELYAVLVIILYLSSAKFKIRPKSEDFKIILLNTIYIGAGLVSNIIYQYQVFPAIITDMILNYKFVFGIYTTYYLFKNLNFKKYQNRIKQNIQFIVFILFILVLLDEVLGFFPCNEIRYGIRSEQLFFGHPTGLASVSFFLILMLMAYHESKIKDRIFLSFACVLLISTLRAKAMGALLIFLFMYIIIIVYKRKIRTWQILLSAATIVLLAWNQIYGYFFSSMRMEMARGALLIKSFEIVQDYFPFGTGLGTYASAPSGDYYSPVYPMYSLNTVWGLSKDFPAFVSDIFWPMVFGQTGVIGTIAFMLMLLEIVKKIIRVYDIDRRMHFVGLGSIGYLLISSTSESAFVNPLSLPLSLLIGMCFIMESKGNRIIRGCGKILRQEESDETVH